MKGPRKTEVFQKIHQFKSQQLKAINSLQLSVIITKLFNRWQIQQNARTKRFFLKNLIANVILNWDYHKKEFKVKRDDENDLRMIDVDGVEQNEMWPSQAWNSIHLENTNTN